MASSPPRQRKKSNAELLSPTGTRQNLPDWFRQSENMLQLPQSQLQEAMLHYMCARLPSRPRARTRRRACVRPCVPLPPRVELLMREVVLR